jgi:CDP-6-deoxy-D-xylo-4-hexulose-3-dehydrase
MLFAGNLIKHPCFDKSRKSGAGYRIAGTLDNTNRIMNDTFWLGEYPGINDEMIDRMIEVINKHLITI